ncbi:MAG: hypothetical protein ACFFCS_17110 [Candidatus Hodarchaeota archaeon]
MAGKIKITVNARDQPGELVKILKPLSDLGANIHGVFHDHKIDDDKHKGYVPVEIIFTLDPTLSESDRKEKIEKIKQALTDENLEVSNISVESVIRKKHVIFIGHIFDTDVRDSIIQLTETGATVVDLKASITGIKSKSTVMFNLTYDKDDIEGKLINKFDHICKQKDLKYISS